MEWVETTGRSLQEAKEAALDELGVDEADAEFDVLAEAQTGLFGRLRSEARVRARVRPTAPRAKEDRRDRRRRPADGGSRTASAGSTSTTDASPPSEVTTAPRKPERGPGLPEGSLTPPANASTGVRTDAEVEESPAAPSGGARKRNRRRSDRRSGSANGEKDVDATPKGPDVEVALERQAEVAADFLTQLTAEFGLDATVTVARPDDETVELQLSGSDLGILIGPKGTTLTALQNLTRTVVFNETGGSNGHINVDVSGYRQKRTEALVRFATQVADNVKKSGARTVLEPMSSIDRKVVHDTISTIEGVSTISEGEEPRRRVVVLPG